MFLLRKCTRTFGVSVKKKNVYCIKHKVWLKSPKMNHDKVQNKSLRTEIAPFDMGNM